MTTDLINKIEDTWKDRQLLEYKDYQDAIETTILKLDRGELRMAEPIGNRWHVNDWIAKAIALYFPLRELAAIEVGPLMFYDKLKLKTDFKETGVRVVPQALARYGSFLGKGVVMMPSYVNIGAYVDQGTIIETGVNLGSGAQIGKQVHIGAGVEIGNAIFPEIHRPVILEDHCYIGPHCILNDGVLVGSGSVLGPNVVLNRATPIIDVTAERPREIHAEIPTHSIVISGSFTKNFPAGSYQVPCALIIGQRKAGSNKRASLEEALRTHHLAL